MSENRWQAYRAGILNYWYYDEAEFYFADGRLLLRGWIALAPSHVPWMIICWGKRK